VASFFYYLGLAFLLTHELDAMTHAEWHLLFVLRALPDSVAEPVFVALHFPLLFAVLWYSQHRREAFRNLARLLVGSFLVVHTGLHFALSGEPLNGFNGAMSQLLILGAGGCAAIFLLMLGRERVRETRTQ